MFKKRYLLAILSVMMFIACSDTLWDELPSPISTFITTYYPNSGISDYQEKDGNYYVKIKNGASMTRRTHSTDIHIQRNAKDIPIS